MRIGFIIIARHENFTCQFLRLVISGISSAASTVCPRFVTGSIVTLPEDLFSRNGVLNVTLEYETTVDDNGNTLFCYMLPDGNQSPTLHVHPGDHLIVTLINGTPQPSSSTTMAMQMNTSDDTVCGATTADDSSTICTFTAPILRPCVIRTM